MIWNLTFLGILIVFMVLGILYIFFVLMGKLFSRKKPVMLETKRGIYTTSATTVGEGTEKVEETRDEIAVVIATAVAACMGESKRFRIQGFKMVGKTQPSNSWKFRVPAFFWKAHGWKHRSFSDGLQMRRIAEGGRRR